MTTTYLRGTVRPSGGENTVERQIRRRVGLPSGRAVIGGLLMAVAAIGTFVAATTTRGDDPVEVLVAARELRPGDVIELDDVRPVHVELSDGVRGLFGSTDAAVGRQVVAAVGQGEFLLESATVVPTAGAETLEVTLRVPVSRAAGRLRPGDRVDVFSTWSSSVTELIAVDARVLEIGSRSGNVLGGDDQVLVRLAVGDFSQIEALVHAQAAGDITMIRASIGSEVHQLGREYRPSTRPASSTADATTSDHDESER